MSAQFCIVSYGMTICSCGNTSLKKLRKIASPNSWRRKGGHPPLLCAAGCRRPSVGTVPPGHKGIRYILSHSKRSKAIGFVESYGKERSIHDDISWQGA